VARSIYPTILCSTLVLAAMICLRPGTAGDLLNLVNVVRGQSPDSNPYNGGFPPGSLPPSGGRYPLPSAVPGPMTQPTLVGRPASWPGGNPGGPPSTQASFQASPGGPAVESLPSAQVIAVVGPEAILASDLMGRYKAYVEAQASGAPASVLAQQREELIASLKNMVEAKLLYVDAIKTIPADAQKDIEQQINASFDETQVKDLMERTKTKTTAELDAKLHEYGTSLERRRRAFFELQLGRLWLQQQTKKEGDDDIQFTAMWDYYQKHIHDYDYTAKARWEELMVRFDRFATKAEAYPALCEMGNQVLHGAPFGEVAKARSQGPTADQGGLRDWTTKGSLRSDVLDRALFGLPVGAMSQILEDEFGYHIIRVVERKEAGRTSFPDAQPAIKKKLKEEKAKAEADEYLAKLRSRTPVSTIFDTPAGSALAENPSTVKLGRPGGN